jgi:hypothetical protein
VAARAFKDKINLIDQGNAKEKDIKNDDESMINITSDSWTSGCLETSSFTYVDKFLKSILFNKKSI